MLGNFIAFALTGTNLCFKTALKRRTGLRERYVFYVTILCGLAALAMQTASAQVFRCTVGGKPVYQQQPCENVGGKGQEIKLQAAPLPFSQAPSQAPAKTESPAAPTPTPVEPTTVEAKSPVEVMADQCLDWYRPMLRDPRGAYHRDAYRSKDVLTISIFATNGFGGYVKRQAACEFRGARLEATWTKMQAERMGW